MNWKLHHLLFTQLALIRAYLLDQDPLWWEHPTCEPQAGGMLAQLKRVVIQCKNRSLISY